MRNPPPSPTALKTSISEDAIDQLFRQARTHSAWLAEPVPVELLGKAYELARLGPTSANVSPSRFVFLTTPGAKARLRPALAPANVEKTMAAPVTAIIAWDTEFYENLPRLFPQADMRSYFIGNKALIDETASAIVRCKPRTSFSPRAAWGWIADRCPGSTQTSSTRNFFLTASGKSTFSAIWATGTKASSTRVILAWSSTRSRWSFKD
jgi:3-hydroxypropanoate dehydrogenase